MKKIAILGCLSVFLEIDSISAEIDAKGKKLKLVVLLGGSISHIDSTAYQALQELIEDLNKRGIGFCFSYIKGPILDFLKQMETGNVLSESYCYLDVESAIDIYISKNRKKQKS